MSAQAPREGPAHERAVRLALASAYGLAALALVAPLASSPAAAIVGGHEAAQTPEARSAVMVLTSNSGVCSGVVVAHEAVLTAGHCVDGIAKNVIHFRDEAGKPVLIAVAARAVHPGYDPDAIRGRVRSIDLALLRTAEPLPDRFSLATLGATAPRAGTDLAIGGFGSTRRNEAGSVGKFRLARLPLVEPYGASRILVWLQVARAAAPAGGCTGDSGGPIFDGSSVVALTAWAKGVCGGLTQGILLGPQRDWIERTLAAWGGSARWAP